MNMVVWVGVLAVVGVIGFIWWDKKKHKRDIETVIVCYSEKVGNTIVEHDKQYKGLISLKNDLFKVPEVNLIQPVPPAYSFIPTKCGNKKVYIIKIDAFRFGFRVPSLNNEIFIQDRDFAGNPIKIQGKPKLKKFKWKYCDDVVEPDVKHWDENIMEKLRQKHRTKNDLLSKWLAPILIGMILVAGIVTVHLTTKYAGERLDAVGTLAGDAAQQSKANTGMIGNLIKRVEERNDNPTGSG